MNTILKYLVVFNIEIERRSGHITLFPTATSFANKSRFCLVFATSYIFPNRTILFCTNQQRPQRGGPDPV